jgi:putative restriction enzyme
MNAQDLEDKVKDEARAFGLKEEKASNAVLRSNIKSDSFKDGGAYFGYIRPEEAPSGVYYDVSFVIFPQETGGKCLVALAVGSAGFQRDYDLISIPWLRRLYKKLASADGNTFLKNDFSNIETSIPELQEKIENEVSNLKKTLEKYKRYILAACVVDPDKDFHIISAWLAQYAQFRGWGNKGEREKQKVAIGKLLSGQQSVDVEADVRNLLKLKRFVVLQGAPGTGKTYNALKIAQDYKGTHLIQFHAETSYTDFVGGIRPVLSSDQLKYEAYDGKLIEAIKTAERVKEETGGRVLLIIDEINRANLANVLGPVFFLFENNVGERKISLQLGSLCVSKLPDNLDVIATMNTADRSLAVVDFALRRRFAWYTIRPQAIMNLAEDQYFHDKLFRTFCDIFERYASDEELNLQPGPSYFLTTVDCGNRREKSEYLIEHEYIMKMRLIYELMPLIKEYLAEGLLQKAADSFAHLFYTEAGVYLYE